MASLAGHTDTAKVLLNQCAQVNMVDNTGRSALSGAVARNQTEVVKFLLEYGARTDLKTSGRSILNLASEIGNVDILQVLIDKGCKTDEADVILAYEHGHKEALKLLTNNKYDSSASPSGQTLQQLLEKLETQKQEQEIFNTEKDILKAVDDLGALQVQEAPKLSDIFRELLPLASHWKSIGEYLKLPPGLLNIISFDNHNRERDCLRETLEHWLKTTDPPPTWEQLVQAVKPIDQGKAGSLNKKHCSVASS